jgi:NAD(P)-dependent dehydrogenase (short-subunit alcohol dehydrogenase family)
MGSLGARPFVLVTGGSSGIGYELAKLFVANGFDVMIAGDFERAGLEGTKVGSEEPVKAQLHAKPGSGRT